MTWMTIAGVRPNPSKGHFIGMMSGGSSSADGPRGREEPAMGYEDFDPEVLDDAVLEELFKDDEDDREQHRPDEHEGEVEDVWSQQPARVRFDDGGEAPARRELHCPIAPSQHEYDDHCRRACTVS